MLKKVAKKAVPKVSQIYIPSIFGLGQNSGKTFLTEIPKPFLHLPFLWRKEPLPIAFSWTRMETEIIRNNWNEFCGNRNNGIKKTKPWLAVTAMLLLKMEAQQLKIVFHAMRHMCLHTSSDPCTSSITNFQWIIMCGPCSLLLPPHFFDKDKISNPFYYPKQSTRGM